ncbi:proton-coupled folate transporter-like protein, partial [Leptotrombidium deliense]
MAAYSYISQTSIERLRPIRFAVLGLAILLGTTGGTYIGGLIIKTTPIGHDSLHNYIAVFLFSLACYIPAAIYILYIFREPKKSFKIEIVVEERTIDVIETKAFSKNEEEMDEKWYTCLKYLFEWRNVRETFVTLFKSRPNNGRMLLLTSMISYFIIVMTTRGDSGIMFQFAQR